MARTPTPVAAGDTTTPAPSPPPATPPVTDPATATTEDASEPGPTVEVRVLIAFGDHQPNDLVEIREADLNDRLDAGEVDDHPDAIAYVRVLAQ